MTGGNGNPTWTTYNAWNQPESVIEPATAAAPAAADRTWTTGYNLNALPVSVSQPGGISLSYGYDPLGDLTSATGSGASAPTTERSFSYGLDGRLTAATAPGGTDTFTYNGNGELKSASGPSGTSSFSYNADGLVSSETDAAGTTGYTYDSADRLATETDPLTGATLSYGYNADSLPGSIGYSVGGAAGPVQTFGYDSLQRLTSDTVKSASGSVLASQTYGYDANGNLTSQTTGGLMTAATTNYGYDEANRLASATTGGTSTSYSYDGDGNLTQAGAASYAYNAQDQVTSATTPAGTTSYAYTLSGALASVSPPGGSAQNYTSDAYGQLATAPGGISYGYDALGRLVSRTAGSASTSMSYLGTGSTLAFDGTRDYSYTPSGTVTATQVPGGTGYATMSDLHGDLAATFSPTSTAAGLAGYATYSPYGVPAATGYQPAIGYQGNYTDPSTGLVQMGARWYNPATGTFTTNDQANGSPISSTIDANPYAYTSGGPLTQTDPTGHSCVVSIAGSVAWGGCPSSLGGVGAGSQGGVSTGSQGGIQWGLGGRLTCQYFGGCGGQDQVTGNWYMFPGNIDWAALAQGWLGTSSGAGSSRGGGGSSGGGGCTGACGGCVGGCGYPPPQPPPPPQDCYAGPNPTCTPPRAPGSLRDSPWITGVVHDITSFSQLARKRQIIVEGPATLPNVVSGLMPGSANGSPQGGGNDNNYSYLIQHIGDLHPALPAVPGPGHDGKNTRKVLKHAATAVTPLIKALVRPLYQAAQSAIANGVSCVTHPQLSTCLQTLLMVASVAVGGGEAGGAAGATDATAPEAVTGGTSDWAELSGVLRDAAKGKGNFGIGSATQEQAVAAGRAWAGDNATLASDGKTWVSQDMLRQFRPPSYKPNLGMWQANFEWRVVPRGAWFGNGHLNITDLP